MIRFSRSLLLLLLFATACSSPRTPHLGRFKQEEQANLVVRYYTDDTSYVLKPVTKNGEFLTVLNKAAVIELAKQQPERELAVVILIHYTAEDEAEAVKHDWVKLLKEVGYERIVFLRASSGMKINGLSILENPSELTEQPKAELKPSV